MDAVNNNKKGTHAVYGWGRSYNSFRFWGNGEISHAYEYWQGTDFFHPCLKTRS